MFAVEEHKAYAGSGDKSCLESVVALENSKNDQP